LTSGLRQTRNGGGLFRKGWSRQAPLEFRPRLSGPLEDFAC
jgi:hypothetical protein